MKFRIQIIGWILFMASPAWANIEPGVIFSPALMYESYTVSSGGTSSTTTRQLLDFRFGFLSGEGLYYGAYYGTYTAGSGSTLTDTKIGASIGYINKGWNFIFTYFIDAQNPISTSTTRKGTGYELDLGYAFDVGGWALGPQLSYYSNTYTKQVINGTESTISDYGVSGIIPKFALWFTF